MVAIVMRSGGVPILAWYLSMAAVLVAGVALAPKTWRTDRRLLALLAVVALGAVGGAVADTVIICPYQGTIWEFLCYVM